MAVKSRAVSVGTTATRLDTESETDTVAGSSAIFYNNGAASVFIGGPDVTTANGAPVPAGTWGPSVPLDKAEAVYAIVTAGTVDVRVFEVGV